MVSRMFSEHMFKLFRAPGTTMHFKIAYITFLDTALAALTSIAVPSLVSALSDDVKFIFYLAAGAAFVG